MPDVDSSVRAISEEPQFEGFVVGVLRCMEGVSPVSQVPDRTTQFPGTRGFNPVCSGSSALGLGPAPGGLYTRATVPGAPDAGYDVLATL